MDLSRSEADAIGADHAQRSRFDAADLQSACRLPIAPTDGLVGSLERKRLQLYLVLILADTAVLFGTFLASTAIYYGSSVNISQIKDGLAASLPAAANLSDGCPV